MAERGGFKQQLKRYQAQHGGLPVTSQASSSSNTQSGDSKLAIILLQKWCWGTMSLPLLQSLAAAGVQDGLQQPLLRFIHM